MHDRPPLVLSLAHPRSEWARRLTGWATSGVVALRHQPCLTAAEVGRRLEREPVAAVISEARLARPDGDLVALARAAGTTVIPVGDQGEPDATEGGGLPAAFAPEDLLGLVPTEVPRPATPSPAREVRSRRAGALVVVAGVAGSGVSTVAALVACGLQRHRGGTLLAELTGRADQALRHGLADAHPGLAHCLADDADTARRLDAATHPVPDGYHLLPGVTAPEHRGALPAGLGPVVDAGRARFGVVVAECEPSSVGPLTAAPTTGPAPTLALVTRPDAVGVHRLCALVREVGPSGGDLLLVLNDPGRSLRSARPAADALRRLLGATGAPPRVVVSRHRRGLEGRIRDGRPLRPRRGPATALDRAVAGAPT